MSTRRSFVKNSAAGIGLFPLSAWVQPQQGNEDKKMKIVCIGGHPDDPESGCGGTLAKFASMGHDCTIIYLTRGEAGIPGKTHDEAAAIRTREAEAACQILKVKAVFAGQIDGDTVVNREWIKTIQSLFETEKPDIVFTQWPVDTHRDHQAASILSQQAWLQMNRSFVLYFYEVCFGSQSNLFSPTDYIDISNEQEQKRKAIYCHVSQDPPGIYDCGHAAMEDLRGRAIGAKAGEAFIRMVDNRTTIL